MNKNTVDLFYREVGQGIPIVFLHGFPLDHTTWLPISQLMADRARSVLPDLRGLGQSPVVGTEATIELMAEDVTRLMDKLEIPQAVIVGHSMGGYIAMQLAHSFPDRISGLVLVATRSETDAPDKISARLSSREAVLKNGTAELVDSMAARLTDDPSLLLQLREIMEKTSPHGVAMAQFAMAHRNDATPWLSEIALPILVVAGAKDVIIPIESMKIMAQRVCCGKFYSSEKATHMIPLEEPELIARALEETFIK
jgi:pimeloyl-ACP methyl ester carboxylesterase